MRATLGRVLVFAVLGPPLGGLAFVTVAIWLDADPGNTINLLISFFRDVPFLKFLLLSYGYGAIPFVLAGILIECTERRRRKRHIGIPVVIGLFVGISYAVLFPLLSAEKFKPLLMAALTIACLLPTLICWTITTYSIGLHVSVSRKFS